MSYHTPVVYIFSVLEVNLAILCASIPIFWPLLTSLATNKILVVNEIVVHVETYPKSSLDGQPGIGLAEQGAWGKSEPPSPHTPPRSQSRLSTVKRSLDPRGSRDSYRASKHRSKSSVSSSIHNVFRGDAGRVTKEQRATREQRATKDQRSSQDSQRHLYHCASADSGSLAKSDYDWFAELDRECIGKRTTTVIEKGGT
jgi:hypothetical protein